MKFEGKLLLIETQGLNAFNDKAQKRCLLRYFTRDKTQHPYYGYFD